MSDHDDRTGRAEAGCDRFVVDARRTVDRSRDEQLPPAAHRRRQGREGRHCTLVVLARMRARREIDVGRRTADLGGDVARHGVAIWWREEAGVGRGSNDRHVHLRVDSARGEVTGDRRSKDLRRVEVAEGLEQQPIPAPHDRISEFLFGIERGDEVVDGGAAHEPRGLGRPDRGRSQRGVERREGVEDRRIAVGGGERGVGDFAGGCEGPEVPRRGEIG
jgi:hypothetical protein